MRFKSLVLAVAFVAVAGTAAQADDMMKASPKPSPSAMHSSAMHGHMMATPKPKANVMHGHMMAHPSAKPSAKP